MNNRNLSEIEDGREPTIGEVLVASVFVVGATVYGALFAACVFRALWR